MSERESEEGTSREESEEEISEGEIERRRLAYEEYLRGIRNMAHMTIKEVTELIEEKEYDGDEKTLNLYIRNKEALAEQLPEGGMNRFLLAAQLKLKKKAAEAMNNVTPTSFEDIKKALITLDPKVQWREQN